MYVSKAYGLTLQSEIPLLTNCSYNKESAVSNIDVKITLENIENFSNNEGVRERILLGKLANVGKFLIEDGRKVIIDPEPGISNDILRPCILGSAMAVVLQQRGFLVLHASCIVINGMAIAFLGHSGDGKSTICSAFHARGYEVLTDDVLVIDIARENILVIPSFPEIKLRSDSASLIGYKEGILSPLHPLTNKKVHQIKQGFSLGSVPLKYIYVLDKGEQSSIKSLSAKEGFIELVKHTRSVNTLRNQNLEKTHFEKCTTMVQKIPIFRLVRKFSLSEIFSVVEIVEKALIDA